MASVSEKLEKRIRENFVLASSEEYAVLRFDELEVGDKYIALPTPGDNSGNGGFRTSYFIFVKTNPVEFKNSTKNALRLDDGVSSYSPSSMPVIKLKD